MIFCGTARFRYRLRREDDEMKTIEMLIGGAYVSGESTLPVCHKATGEQIAAICTAGEAEAGSRRCGREGFPRSEAQSL